MYSKYVDASAPHLVLCPEVGQCSQLEGEGLRALGVWQQQQQQCGGMDKVLSGVLVQTECHAGLATTHIKGATKTL
jgi:hypothetical protein